MGLCLALGAISFGRLEQHQHAVYKTLDRKKPAGHMSRHNSHSGTANPQTHVLSTSVGAKASDSSKRS